MRTLNLSVVMAVNRVPNKGKKLNIVLVFKKKKKNQQQNLSSYRTIRMVELRRLYTVTSSLAKGHYLLLYPRYWDCHSSRSVWTIILKIRFDL